MVTVDQVQTKRVFVDLVRFMKNICRKDFIKMNTVGSNINIVLQNVVNIFTKFSLKMHVVKNGSLSESFITPITFRITHSYHNDM